jgi:hypothetical protein
MRGKADHARAQADRRARDQAAPDLEGERNKLQAR